ncbi:MAG TPA: serine hydrolase domain-containing protein [Terricaulis sp.]|nr:serine hydrolase domain-containing protein [Terricaulis sp.]
MRVLLGPVVALSLWAHAGAASADTAADIATLDRLFSQWSGAQTAGCAVGVARPGEPTLLRGYGMADLADGVAIDAQTRFEVGSVSKQFVAAAVLTLVEEGRLSLDADIRRYFPQIPDYGAVITVDHLLNHTSGLRDWGFAAEIAGWPRTTRAMSNSDVLALTARQRELNHAPGADYSYTNTGYVLLAMLVEQVAGVSLAAFTQERFFGPLGMNDTGWRDDFRRVQPRRAVAYVESEAGWVERMPFEDVYGDAALITSVGDLLIWNEALFAGRLSAFVTQHMMEQAQLSDGSELTYGRGLEVTTPNGVVQVSHGGAIGGYRAWLAHYPQTGLSVALACNAGDGVGVGLGARQGRLVAEAFLPARAPDQTRAVRTNARAYAGLFVSNTTGLPLNFTVRNGALLSAGGAALTPIAARRFTLGGNEYAFESPDRLRVRRSTGAVETYRREAPVQFNAAEAGEIEGCYRSAELDAGYQAAIEDGALVLRLEDRPGTAFTLAPLHKDAWTYDTRFGPRTAIVAVVRAEGGAVQALRIGWNGRIRGVLFSRC